MLRYSPNGYLVAIKLRTLSTLLVEGRTDRAVASRLKQELTRAGSPCDVTIDSAEHIDSPVGAVMGNREKVEYVHSLAEPDLRVKFGGLVDREWREFEFFPIKDKIATCFVSNSSLFWTRGHSIENYFINMDSVEEVLVHYCSEMLQGRWKESLAQIYRPIVVMAVAISLAAKDTSTVERLRGVSSIAHWKIDERNEIEFDWSKFQRALALRAIGGELFDVLQKAAEEYVSKLSECSIELLQWVGHGRLATEFVWAGVGKFVAVWSNDLANAKLIGEGNWELKRRIGADRLAVNEVRGAGVDLLALTEWMRACA